MSITYIELVANIPLKFHPDLSTLIHLHSPFFVLRPDLNWKRSIWDMRYFYISSFIKIWSPIHKINLPSFSRFPLSPIPPPVGWIGKRLLSSQLLHVPDTPTNFYCPSPSRSTKLTEELEICPPLDTPKDRGSGSFMSIIYLGLVLILSTKFHPDLSSLSVFQDFWSLSRTSPNVIGSGQDLK